MQPADNKSYVIKEVAGSFKGYGKKIAWRIAVLAYLVFMIVSLLIFGFDLIEEKIDHFSKTDDLRQCEYSYYQGDYTKLLDRLHLYKGYDERFDKYWEIAKAYEDLRLYRVWSQAAAELDQENKAYSIKAAIYKEKVIKAYEQCVNEENKRILKGFRDQLEERGY